MNCARSWLAALAKLSADDLRLISQLVDRLVVAERGKADVARVMLDAKPEPFDFDEARARIRTVVEYLDG